jgi:endonuclease-3 related protein
VSESRELLAERERLLAIYHDLDTMHAWRGWHWWPDADPFEVIVGAILVQNTMWSNVERALDRLRAADALTPGAMAALSLDELQELVRPSGQYRQKALKLAAFLALIKEHGGLEALLALEPQTLRTRLLATWGIGPETADCIILYAAREPKFIVDAYLIRLFTRLEIGPVGTTNYDTWQRYFETTLHVDRDEWSRFRAEIVLHCKYLCLKNRPKCSECLLFDRCPGSPMRAGMAT